MSKWPAWVQAELDAGRIREEELAGWGVSLYGASWPDVGRPFIDIESDAPYLCLIGGGLVQAKRSESFREAFDYALNLIDALSGQPTAEVERLKQRVGELEEAAKDYVAWLVERRDVPGALRYLAFNSIGETCWVDCADDACHFARKADAMQWAESETMELHVCDHQWSGGQPRDPVIQQYEWRKDDTPERGEGGAG